MSNKVTNKSPAEMTDPIIRLSWIFLISVAFKGMIIFIASTSTHGCPVSKSVPGSCRYCATLPVTSARSSDGSKIVGLFFC